MTQLIEFIRLKYDLKREYFTIGVPTLLSLAIIIGSLLIGFSSIGEATGSDAISERQRAYEELLKGMELMEGGAEDTEGMQNVAAPSGDAILGTHLVRFVAEDGHLHDAELVTIIVNRRISNRAPVFETIPPIYGKIGEPVVVHLRARDPDGDIVEYSIESGPEGLSLENNTIKWIPDRTGEFSIVAKAGDGSLEDREEFQIFIGDSIRNRLPEWEELTPIITRENDPVTFQLHAEDPDGDKILFRARDLPANARLSEDNFAWVPSSEQKGVHLIQFLASDGREETTELLPVMVHGPLNHAPVFEPIQPVLLGEGGSYKLKLTAKDPEGDPIAFGILDMPEGGSLTGNTFTWAPKRDQIRNRTLVFTVSDGEDMNYLAVDLFVASRTNQPPRIEEIPVQFVSEGEPIQIEFGARVKDPESNILTFDVAHLPAGAEFRNRTFFWTPIMNEAHRRHQSVLTVSDGTLKDTEVITFLPKNAINLPPRFVPIPSLAIAENLSFVITAVDPNGDPLTYSAIDLPQGARFENRTFIWEAPTDRTKDTQVTFEVSDGTLIDRMTVSILRDVVDDLPPAWISLEPVYGTTGEEIKFSVQASDPDGDTLRYYVRDLPEGASFIDRTFAWIPDRAQVGPHRIVIHATDGTYEIEGIVMVFVYEPQNNHFPVLSVPSVVYGQEGREISLGISSEDPDRDMVVIRCEHLPAGAEFRNGTFRWIPMEGQSGVYQILFSASDGYLKDLETLTVVVADEYLNRAPEIEHILPKQVVLNETVSFKVTARDPDGDPVTIRAENLPPGAIFENEFFTWKTGSGTSPGIFDQIKFGFDHLLVIALLVAITPYGIDLTIQKRKTRRKEELYVEFLFKLSELMRGGLDPIKSVIELSKTDLGELTPHIRLAATSMTFGKTFEEAMHAMAASLGSDLISRYTELLIVASYSGGSVADLILKASEDMREIIAIEKEKEGNLSQYTFIFYFAQGIIAFIAYTLATSLLPYLQSIGAQTLFGTNAIANLDFRQGFFHLLVINAFFGGLIIGKISEGDARHGLKHASILIAACYIASVLFILPIPATDEEVTVRIDTVSGEDQLGIAGLPLSQPLVFLVEDFEGNPVGNKEVVFSIQPGGQVSPSTKKTDSDGKVSVKAILGIKEGTYVITAKAGGAIKNVQIRTGNSEQ